MLTKFYFFFNDLPSTYTVTTRVHALKKLYYPVYTSNLLADGH